MKIERMFVSVIFPDERNSNHFDFEDAMVSFNAVAEMQVNPVEVAADLMSTNIYEEKDTMFRFFLSPNVFCCIMKGQDDFIIPLFDDMLTQVRSSNPQPLSGDNEFTDLISKIERPSSDLDYMKALLDVHKLHYTME